MQLTIDIPEQEIAALETEAKARQVAMEDIIAERLGVPASAHGLKLAFDQNGLPVLSGGEDTPLALISKHFTNLNDAAFMSDEEIEDMVRQAEALEAAAKRDAA